MKKHLQQRRMGIVAFAVAVLMALQVLLLSPLARASMADALSLNAFGNPLCITHFDEQKPTSAPGKEHSRASDCCTLACGMDAGLFSPDRPVLILFNPLAQPLQRMFDGYGDHRPSVHAALPGHPRGPPAMT